MRRPSFWFLNVLLVIAAEFSPALSGQYTTPNTGIYWDMDDLVAHSGGVVTGSDPEYTFHGSVTISSLDTLMIYAGSTLTFDDSQGDFHLWARGILFAQGTADEMVSFTSAQHIPGAWYGISLDQGIMECCRVEYATRGLTVSYHGSPTTVIHNTIMHNKTGIFLFGPIASAVIRDNYIANNQTCGIGGDGGINREQRKAEGDEWLIEANQILDNGVCGIGLSWGINAIIRCNLISGHDRGIVSGPYGGFTVVENTVVENNWGILCDSNGFPGGLNLGDLGNVSSLDDGGNHIYDNFEYDIYNANAETIKAEGNHWGTADLAVIDGHIYDDQEDEGDADGNGVLSGPVDFVPIGETSVQRSTWGQIKARFK